MAEAPLKYMARYKPLKFAGCGSQGQKSIKLNTYISGDVMSGNSFRTKAYMDLRRFITATLVKISKPEKPRWRRWKLGDREYDAVLRIK